MAQQYCNDCGDELNSELEKLDRDLVKLGFAQEHDGEGYDDEHRKTWLEKPFPYSYRLWVDGLVKEINPRFYVDSSDDVSYIEDPMRSQPTLFEHKESKLNPQLMMGDEILVLDTHNPTGASFNPPKLYTPYVVVGIKRPGTYYEIEAVDITDDELLGDLLAGGGRRRLTHLYPNDTWMLRKGFLRGELNESFVSHSYDPVVGEKIININPGCTHYGSEGVIKDIDSLKDDVGSTITYMVTNNGDTFQKGDTLTKTMDQLAPLDENISIRIKEALNDLVYRDEPSKRHLRRMGKDLGRLSGFPVNQFKNMPPPKNESETTEEELEHLDTITVDKEFIKSADDIDIPFKQFLNSNDLDYPIDEIKKVMAGIRSIILQLKYYYNRPRPGQVANAKGIDFDPESLKSASTPSYPSGHATQGRFIARYLSDLYPTHEEELMKIG